MRKKQTAVEPVNALVASGPIGIKETKELASAVVAVVQVGVKVVKAGGMPSFEDAFEAAKAVKPVIEGVRGITLVDEELADATPEEMAEVNALIESLDLESDDDETDVQDAMKGLAAISRLVARRVKRAKPV